MMPLTRSVRARLTALALGAEIALGLSPMPAHSQTFAPANFPTNTSWLGLTCSADGSLVYAAGTTGLYVSSNGAPAVLLNTGTTEATFVACSADGRELLINGFSNVFLLSSNYGANWQSPSVPSPFWGMACPQNGSVIVALGRAEPVYVSTDGAASWRPVTTISNVTTSPSAIAASASGSRIFVAGSLPSGADNLLPVGCILMSTDVGLSWMTAIQATNGVYYNCIASSADGSHVVAASQPFDIQTSPPGWVSVSSDGGATWTTYAAPQIFLTMASSADGARLAAASWTPATQTRQIFLSSDGGATWQPGNAPAKQWIAATCSADGNKVFAGSGDGGVYVLDQTVLPQLKVTKSVGAPKLSWTLPTIGLQLQQSADLVHWSNAPAGAVVNYTNLLTEQPLIPPLQNYLFYRLKR